MAARPEDGQQPGAGPGCPDEDRLAALLEGKLDAEARSRIQEHVAGCSSCRELLAAAARGYVQEQPPGTLCRAETHWSESSPDAEGFVPATLRRGATVGRYVVLGLIGVGAMGTVYAAYDPELDRKIALKLILASARTAEEREVLQVRLLREAQAMARLSHPGVVPIYDAALVGEEIFVAMEFVEGTTLREWLRDGPHPVAQVLHVYRQAGEGLAAAHAAGIIHRDFKPENVLLGKDGRVRVGDFGLARTGPASATEVEVEGADLPTLESTVETITRTGSLLGTPAYMAPEQMAGEAVGPAADQFSFCVALYEALYGVRPFDGSHLGELYRNIYEGRIRDAGGGSRVPSPIRRALLRGLRASPDQRHPTMEALLFQLRRGLHARRRRAAALLAVVGIVAAGFAIQRLATSDSAALCTGAAAELAPIWNAERARAVRAAFLGTGKPYAARLFGNVKSTLDGYTRGWIEEHTAACRATRVSGHQSEALMDRRIQCLREQRHRLRALVNLFSTADAKVVDKAVEAVGGLAALTRCRPEVLQRSRLKLPATEAKRHRVDALRASLAEVKVLIDAARYRRAQKQVLPLVAAARALDYPPVHAEALIQLAKIQRRLRKLRAARATYEEALHVAASCGHDLVALQAFLGKAWIATGIERKLAEGEDLLRHASQLAPLVGDPRFEADLLYVRGVLDFSHGDLGGSRRRFEEALAIRRKQAGKEHVKTVPLLVALSRVARARRRLQESRTHTEHALRLLMRTYGPDHPRLATSYFQLATVYWRELGDYTRAADLLRRAAELERRARGPRSPELAQDRARLAHLLAHQGQHRKAQRMLEEAVKMLEATLGPEHGKTAWAVMRLGTVLALRGRWAEAQRTFARATRIWERRHGRRHGNLARSLGGEALAFQKLGRPARALAAMRRALAIARRREKKPTFGRARVLRRMCRLLFLQGRPREALPSCRRALAMQEKLLPRKHPEIARTLTATGETLHALRRPSQARPVLERALAILEEKKVHWGTLARARLATAKVLRALGVDERRSRRLVASARALLARIAGMQAGK